MSKHNLKIPIVMYHRIVDEKNFPSCKSYEEAGTVISISEFYKQIKFLIQRYSIVNFTELIDFFHNKSDLPKNSCLITFDDGYLEHYSIVFPILNKLNITGLFFIVGDCISSSEKVRWLDKYYYILDNTKYQKNHGKLKKKISYFYQLLTGEKNIGNRFLLKKIIRSSINKDEIINILANFLEVNIDLNVLSRNLYISKENIFTMYKNGMEFGAHSMTHSDLGQVQLEVARKEIIDSSDILKKIIQKDIVAFAYPFGGQSTFNKEIILILKRNNFLCACTSVPGFNEKSTSMFELKRIDAQNFFSYFY